MTTPLATLLSLFPAAAMAQDVVKPATLTPGCEVPLAPVTSAKWIHGEPTVN